MLRAKFLYAFLAGLAVAIVYLSATAPGSGRNDFGNPKQETFLSECTLDSATVMRLYRGFGDATVGEWYSVTAHPPQKGEKQIFYSYQYPAITSIRCEGDFLIVVLSGKGEERWTEAEAIAQTELGARGYYAGAPKSPGRN